MEGLSGADAVAAGWVMYCTFKRCWIHQTTCLAAASHSASVWLCCLVTTASVSDVTVWAHSGVCVACACLRHVIRHCYLLHVATACLGSMLSSCTSMATVAGRLACTGHHWASSTAKRLTCNLGW